MNMGEKNCNLQQKTTSRNETCPHPVPWESSAQPGAPPFTIRPLHGRFKLTQTTRTSNLTTISV